MDGYLNILVLGMMSLLELDYVCFLSKTQRLVQSLSSYHCLYLKRLKYDTVVRDFPNRADAGAR